ncbi:hypothetical protein AOC03_01990 [Psychrobacter urativorans]|uniref:Uncharacterized protein n=2 Tax=Psychrobacter urativorans TaxID=45610 RepID=A0A0M4U8D7_9GAMM|nr:hypothetical protein AOC03_01990 [Psychrobacter urativorans]
MNRQNLNYSKYTSRYSPRHPLAKHAVSQIGKLELRPQDIVKAMGYPQQHTIVTCDRLRHVLSSDILGLNGSDVDTYFSAHEFLKALLIVLDIPYETFADNITQIEFDLANYPYPLSQYRLRAVINFKFTAGANWMSRGVAASKANVYLPDDIAKLHHVERESIVQQCIHAHYKKYKGNLPYNGEINGYRLIVKQRHAVVDRIEYGLPECE